MADYDFKKDIVLGESGEEVVKNDLISAGSTFISDNKNNKYDLLMDRKGTPIKYEVKTDVYVTKLKDTGNMYIEYECRGKTSGLMVTEAKWFVTYYKHLGEIWYIETEKLKTIITENNIRTHTMGGDAGSNTKGWLLPRAQYKKDFKIRKV